MFIGLTATLTACAGAPRPRPTPALPDIPAPADVTRAMEGLRPRLLACTPDRSAALSVNVSFASSGSVESATLVDGHYVDTVPVLGSPAEHCMLDVVRTARVGAFRQPHFVMQQSFRLDAPSVDDPQAPATQVHCQAGPSSAPGSIPALAISGTVHGALEETDHRLSDESVFDDYTLTLAAGQTVTILVRGEASTSSPGSNMDMYTFLMCGGEEVTHDDDSGGNLNSRLIVTSAAVGTYTLRINTYGAGLKTGAYTIETWAGAQPGAS